MALAREDQGTKTRKTTDAHVYNCIQVECMCLEKGHLSSSSTLEVYVYKHSQVQPKDHTQVPQRTKYGSQHPFPPLLHFPKLKMIFKTWGCFFLKRKGTELHTASLGGTGRQFCHFGSMPIALPRPHVTSLKNCYWKALYTNLKIKKGGEDMRVGVTLHCLRVAFMVCGPLQIMYP